MDSILVSIKKLLGLEEAYTYFDTDIVMHINSVLSVLTQLGVGPPQGFSIQDASATWDDFLGEDTTGLDAVRSYVYMRVRLMFDPPTSSAAMDSMSKIISELEWRIHVTMENKALEGGV